jgi:hypothetical protein
MKLILICFLLISFLFVPSSPVLAKANTTMVMDIHSGIMLESYQRPVLVKGNTMKNPGPIIRYFTEKISVQENKKILDETVCGPICGLTDRSRQLVGVSNIGYLVNGPIKPF